MKKLPLHGPGPHARTLHDLDVSKVTAIRGSLLQWYAENARTLPWRLPPISFGSTAYEEYVLRAYKSLLSETMLQQTQVKTVIAYYTKWLVKFPSMTELADASEEDVMACWAGLGYYSRAKRLHQAAQYLMANFISKGLPLPVEPERWIKDVPGVGPYTAGAIISISFGIPSAIVDGNVQRVLSRVLAIHGDTSTPNSQGVKLLWRSASRLVDGQQPGEFNQSLMDLGATICSPKNPSCPTCPISSVCLAYQQSLDFKPAEKVFADFYRKVTDKKSEEKLPVKQAFAGDIEDLCKICPQELDHLNAPTSLETFIQDYYPFKPVKKALREETAMVLVISRGTSLYLEKKVKGLLAGLFDFPTILVPSTEDVDEGIEAKKCELGATHHGSTLHLFSHIRRTSHVLTCHSDSQAASALLSSLKEANASGRWVDKALLADLGVSELCLKNSRLAFGIDKPKSKPKPKLKVSVKRPAAISHEGARTSNTKKPRKGATARVHDSSSDQEGINQEDGTAVEHESSTEINAIVAETQNSTKESQGTEDDASGRLSGGTAVVASPTIKDAIGAPDGEKRVSKLFSLFQPRRRQVL